MAVERRRDFRSISYKGAHYRYYLGPGRLLASLPREIVPQTLRRLRRELESYLKRFPPLEESLAPLAALEKLPHTPPESARRMHAASLKTLGLQERIASSAHGSPGIGPVGPMAAVAGTLAELILEEILSSVAELGEDPSKAEVVVENGGDICMQLQSPLYSGLYLGPESPFSNLAFSFEGGPGRYALCSSSSAMGHSLSFGRCDLVTVFSPRAPVADAAATALCNSITGAEKMDELLERICTIEEIDGAVAIVDEKLGRAGRIPLIVEHQDPGLRSKVSRDPDSDFE